MSIDRIKLFGNNDEDDDDDQNNGETPHFEPEVIGDSDRQQSDSLDPKPWSLTVEGIELLNEIRDRFRDHVVLCKYSEIACSVWALYSWLVNVFRFSPRLFIRSPTHGCGKSTLIDLLELLVRRPLKVTDATGASLLRQIEALQPTLLIDEHDSMRYRDTLRNVFNSGFTPSGFALRTDRTYGTFSALALASNERLHATMEDRSVVIRLKKALPTEKIKSLRDFSSLNLRQKCMRWSLDHVEALEIANPMIPLGVEGRVANVWAPLLAVADEIGGDWPKLTREAAVALSVRHEVPTTQEQLLKNIYEVFGQDERLFSSDLVKRLIAKDDSQWGMRGLNEWMMAEMLESFEIRPKRVRIGSETKRGYMRGMFLDAWKRWRITP